MKNILYIDSAISDNSRTRLLCGAYIKKYFSGGEYTVTTLRLSELDIRALDKAALSERILSMQTGKPADAALARQIAAADILIVGAPYYDFSFPALLKIYIENIMINEVTFVYDQTGMKGLCKAEKLVYITTSGGYIKEGFDFGYEYIRGVCSELGIGTAELISAQGLDIQGNNADSIIEETIAGL